MSLPPQVVAFNTALERLVAVRDVGTGLKNLADFPLNTYSFPGEFGDLPHALLRRTNGGLEGEKWVNTDFELTKDDAGWRTLEFLAWWVRDLSRGGEQIQFRPMALPPKAYEVQLGRTLKFIIDHFVVCEGDTLDAALETMQDRANSLNGCIDSYADILGDLVRT